MTRKLCMWMMVLVIIVSSVIIIDISIDRDKNVGNETAPFQTEPQQSEPEVTDTVVPTTTEQETTPETTCVNLSEPTYEDTYETALYKLTAYCPCSNCCGPWADGITATGTVATQGRTIAVDPSVIPYGTEVVINGHTYVAEDCGGAINGNKIDIFFDTHQEALEFGVQYAEVKILG